MRVAEGHGRDRCRYSHCKLRLRTALKNIKPLYFYDNSGLPLEVLVPSERAPGEFLCILLDKELVAKEFSLFFH